MNYAHSFHIPVMGIGYTLDTPLKVAHLGISSVISLVDDLLLEQLRKVYAEKHHKEYTSISENSPDYRAKRITAWLNLVDDLVSNRFHELKNSLNTYGNDIKEYLSKLPNYPALKHEIDNLKKGMHANEDTFKKLRTLLQRGSIDVNIMTKVDKTNYHKGRELPAEYNDAHAALRGFALSKLRGSVVLSAGMNPRLYAYMENFDDFFPDENGLLKKKIILKVSDYKSALIQGKYFAKKGLWVSEYRVESGLNCGGHAFATDGFLMGPILQEFKNNKSSLIDEVFSLYTKALENKCRPTVKQAPETKISAQGGVGTAEEHQFLLETYKLDSIGWGSPFLLVPEATTVDDDTLQNLMQAKEKDLYLSNISPLGVPFNNLRNNTKDQERDHYIAQNKPGSPCPKKYVKLNNEMGKKALCTASRTYQLLKIKQLNKKELTPEQYDKQYRTITEKSCICAGLGTSAMIKHHIDTKEVGPGVSICPGPNIAYFSRKISLNTMIDHIYGRQQIIERNDRPHMFIKELFLYIDYLKNKISETDPDKATAKQLKYLSKFSYNLIEGINYYQNLFSELKSHFQKSKNTILSELDKSLEKIYLLQTEINQLQNVPIKTPY